MHLDVACVESIQKSNLNGKHKIDLLLLIIRIELHNVNYKKKKL